MKHILTFVASSSPLTEQHIKRAREIVESFDIQAVGTPSWSVQNKAADIYIDRRAGRDVLSALRAEMNSSLVDVFISAVQNRRKKLLLADMESTIVDKEALDELGDILGIREQIAEITHQAMEGKLDFQAALRERVLLLKGLPEINLKKVLDSMNLNPGARELTAAIKRNGGVCVLVSGGFTFFTGPVAKMAGFDHDHGNIIEVSDGVLTGAVLNPILDKNSKLEFLNKYLAELNLEMHDAMTIGDGANDIPMLVAARDGGFGYQPKQAVIEAVKNIIVHCDLAAPLYALDMAP
jgi:phosphoserine phosphatase